MSNSLSLSLSLYSCQTHSLSLSLSLSIHVKKILSLSLSLSEVLSAYNMKRSNDEASSNSHNSSSSRLPRVASRLLDAHSKKSVSDEADALFPNLKVEPVEPKLRPPQDPLGRNPFTEMRKRAEHERQLSTLDAATQMKIHEAKVLLEERRAANDRLLHPVAAPLSDEEVKKCEQDGYFVSHILSAACHAPTAVESSGAVVNPAPAQEPWTTTRPAAELTVSHSVALWGADEAIDIRPPGVTADDAKQSKAQMIKHKIEKHRGYYGDATLDLSAAANTAALNNSSSNPDDEKRGDALKSSVSLLFPPGQVISFGYHVEKLLSMHPSTPSIPTHGVQDVFVLDRYSVVDAHGLLALFGSTSVKLTRVTGELLRNSERCPKGVPPASDPPAFLQELRLSLTGKPATHWYGDPVQVELHLSRYAFTPKTVSISTSCKKFPNVFTRFGVNICAVENVSPFPLRFSASALNGGAQDVAHVGVEYHAKSQERVCTARFPMELFQGSITADATLVVASALTPSDCAEGDASIVPITVDLTLTIADHLDRFSFRGVSSQLAFLDQLECKGRVLRITQEQPRACAGESGVAAPCRLEERLEITTNWHIRQLPLFSKLFDDEPFIRMSGWLSKRSRRTVCMKSAVPSQRSALLWNFIRLRNVVAFIEAQEAVCEIGAYCSVDVEVDGQTLTFNGRLKAHLADATRIASTAQQVHDRPSCTFRFEGAMANNAWSNVGGSSFFHITDPQLCFDLDGCSLLPLSFYVHGSSARLQCAAEKGLGVTCDHSFAIMATTKTIDEKKLHSKHVGVVANFPIDNFPNYVVTADISSCADGGEEEGHHLSRTPNSSRIVSTLRDVVAPLFSPDDIVTHNNHNNSSTSTTTGFISNKRSEALASLFEFAQQVVICDATVAWNPSFSELPSADSSGERYAPGLTIRMRNSTLQVFGAPCRIRGDLQVMADASSRAATPLNRAASSSAGALSGAVSIVGSLRLTSPVHYARWPTQSSGRCSGGPVLQSSTVVGQGPICKIACVLSSSQPKWSATLVDATLYMEGLGSHNLDSAGCELVVADAYCRVHLMRLEVLCVPPDVVLQNDSESVRSASKSALQVSGGHSVHTALGQFFRVGLSLRSVAGCNLADPTQPASLECHSDTISAHLGCGVKEALLDIFYGKVAAFRAVIEQHCLALQQNIAGVADERRKLQTEVGMHRGLAVEGVEKDLVLLQAAQAVLITECAKLSNRAYRSSVVSLAAEQRNLLSHTETRIVHKPAQLPTNGLRCARHAVIDAALAKLLHGIVGPHSVFHSTWLQYRGAATEQCSFTSHMPVLLDKLYVTLPHLAATEEHLRGVLDTLSILQELLSTDEAVFSSLFQLLSCRLHGGTTSAPGIHFSEQLTDTRVAAAPHASAVLFLTTSGIIRGQHFCIIRPVASAFDHTALLAALNTTTVELLQMYLTSIRDAL